jgi:hypothetical protein
MTFTKKATFRIYSKKDSHRKLNKFQGGGGSGKVTKKR